MISVVLPTISGREEYLARAIASIERTVPEHEILLFTDLPTCGEAWNAGIVQAQGDHILLFADDLEAHDGWLEAGLDCLARHMLPCPRILNWDGSLQSCGSTDRECPTGTGSEVARVPFFHRGLVDTLYPIFSNHYAGDYWITWRARQAGWPTIVVREMVFTHHMLEQGRLDTLTSDWAEFKRVTR